MTCNRAAPDVAQVAQRYRGQVDVIGVPGSDSVPPMRAFVERHGLQDVTQIHDATNAVRLKMGVIGQPAWVFVDGQSGRVDRVAGELPPDEVARRLDALVRP